jgi:hypothetical protein
MNIERVGSVEESFSRPESCLKNSAHLSSFLKPRTVRAFEAARASVAAI